MIELILPPLLGAIALACTTGPLGCFVVWRRMAYFGDTIAHAALLGISAGILLHVSSDITVIVTCLILALMVSYFQSKHISIDTTLGILAHGGLALGMLSISAISHTRVNIQSALMGDLLTITYTNLIMISCVSAVLAITLMKCWKRLLMAAIDEDLAQVEGYSPYLSRFLLTAMISLTIAFGIKLVGALLVSGMLIIPAAAARKLSSSPEAMAFFASVIGITSSVSGLFLSAFFDLPAGPAIVSCALLIFIITQIFGRQSI